MSKLFRLFLLGGCLLISSLTNAQNALAFDGSNDWVDLGSDSSLACDNGKITVEAWVYATAWKTQVFEGGIVVKEENTSNLGYMFRAGDGGKLGFTIGNGSWNECITKSAVLKLNQWHHIAGTFDGSKLRVYVDGVQVDSLTATIQLGVSYKTNVAIGNHSSTSYSRYFQGYIDEVRIWNTARNISELNANRGYEFCSPEKGLVGYYKFNQGTAAGTNTAVKTLIDYSGQGNVGTLKNFALTGTTSNWIKGVKLVKNASFHDSVTVTRCERYTLPGKKKVLTKSGIYYDTLPTYFGCDSSIKVDLTINKITYYSKYFWVCDSVVSPISKTVYKQSGTYKETLTNSAGCDSVVTWVVKIGSDTSSIVVSQCHQYWLPSGKKITQSGVYHDTLKNAINCDSVIHIYATIFPVSKSKIVRKTCYKPISSPSGKFVIEQPGIYYDTLKNWKGCDSIVEIEFDFLWTFSQIKAVACNQWVSPSGRQTLYQTGIYKDTILNQALCDSIITIDLKILNSSQTVVPISGCRFVVSPLNPNRKFVLPGQYRDTLKNFLGCDSIIVWDVTVIQVEKGVTQDGYKLTAVSNSGTYQWLDCKNKFAVVNGETQRLFVPKLNGEYSVEVTEKGCKDTSYCRTVYGVSNSLIETSQPIIYPVPTSGELFVDLGGWKFGELQNVEILNVHGAVVASGKPLVDDKRLNVQSEMLKKLPPGVYRIRLTAHNGGWTGTFILQ